MSEHRRKPPPPQGGGRAAARRGQPGPSSGRRAAPRGATEASADSYGDEPAYGSRAEARRATQRGGGRRRGPDNTGPGRGRGRAAAAPASPRFIDYPRAGKDGWQRWLPSWKLVATVCVAFFGSLVAVTGIGYAMVAVPDIAKTANAQNNVYEWSDGSVMVATGGEINRQNLNYAQIPAEMRYAVISQENKTFETDSGVDPKGIARAFVNMARGGQTQGGSTITQQFVKNAMLNDQSQTISRKFKEILVAVKVGATMRKEDVMAGYLNSAYYGRGAYGIQAAARAYFDKDAKNLNAGECAFLAAMLKGATYYDPAGAVSIDPAATSAANTARATRQMQDTLSKMVEYNHLSAAERSKYTKLPTVQSPHANGQLSGQIGYLVDLAKGYLISHKETGVTADKLQQGGYTIRTTFDKKKVGQLEKAVETVRKANIKPELRKDTDKYVQFGGASVDPKSGAIKAIYGGEDWTKHFTDNADATGAQVGSTFKPFVLAAAMKWGVRNPDGAEEQPQDERTKASWKSLYSGKNKLKIKEYNGRVWTDKEGKEWLQANDGDESKGDAPDYKIDLRYAMRFSVNSAFVQLGMDVGLDKVKQSALDAGVLENSLASSNFPSFSIGTSDPSAIRMAGAYATFAASGTQRDPYSVSQVSGKDGVIYTHKTKSKDAFTSDVADNVTDVLKTVVDKGTGTAARLPGRDVAGKTGTTDGNKSAWFVGYTPQLSTAISMFRMDDQAKPKDRKFLEMYGTGGQKEIHGASFPAQIWHDYMIEALQNEPKVKFPTPVPYGKALNVAPSPAPVPSATQTPTTSPSPSPSPSESELEPSPSATITCGFFGCRDGGNGNGGNGNNNGGNGNGGNDTGGLNGGTDTGGAGDPSPSTSATETTGTGTTRGFFGGQDG
ncbi:transglycosylase domain-containing protein [Streptomyces sp. NPDC026659]|uniref:transglycosylase domain-containing protein n=1 Tax=Streptomyces sp. NPDC026659 TaxID=3155123 RepID=UPI0033DC3F55